MPNDDHDRLTVRSAHASRPASYTLLGLSGAAVLALIAVVGTALLFLSLWWFRWRVNAEAEIRRDSFNFQVTAEERVIKLDGDLATIDVQLADPSITNEQSAALTAQRKAIAAELCSNAARLNNPKPVAAQIIAEEC